MPELPEVETIAKYLRDGVRDQPSVLGMKVSSVDLLWERTMAEPSPRDFKQRVVGQSVESIWRRGKYLVIGLSDDTLLIHLRMSGDLFVEPTQSVMAKHNRLVINFENKWRLTFNDSRKFGRVWLVSDPDTILGNLGPEPLDELFTVSEFHKNLQKYRRQLKPLLMDQSFIAGLGNIYTDEALHLARLHPLESSNYLSIGYADKLLNSIRVVLTSAIERNGTSIDWIYKGGDYQKYLRVYGRTGEYCRECSQQIERIIVGQRSTHLCPNCQVRLK